MIRKRVEDAQREAGPDRRAEIERHPGDLALPLGKVVRHDPARADVVETRERPQKLAAVANAIHNALGKRFYSLPMSPPKVLEVIDGPELRQAAE